MAASGSVVSINVGQPRSVEWHGRQVLTSIWKTPVDGRLTVAGINLDGDLQSDRRVHGGPDKAVYAYAYEDYRWWDHELGDALAPGSFGENLTVAGLDLRAAVVGEEWAIGTALLQVTQPRLPCFKLGLRMGDASFVERFEKAGRYGVYLRILRAGELGAGDEIEVRARPDEGVEAALIGDVHTNHDPDRLRRLVKAPAVPESWREWATRQLERTERTNP